MERTRSRILNARLEPKTRNSGLNLSTLDWLRARFKVHQVQTIVAAAQLAKLPLAEFVFRAVLNKARDTLSSV